MTLILSVTLSIVLGTDESVTCVSERTDWITSTLSTKLITTANSKNH